MDIEVIDWESRIKKSPKRYELVFGEDKSITEVHDMKTSDVWISIGENRWMKL